MLKYLPQASDFDWLASLPYHGCDATVYNTDDVGRNTEPSGSMKSTQSLQVLFNSSEWVDHTLKNMARSYFLFREGWKTVHTVRLHVAHSIPAVNEHIEKKEM